MQAWDMPFDREVLHRELTAEDGTFLLKVRQLDWDRAAFSRLEAAMRTACPHLENETSLERWIVNGFWFLSDWLPTWTSHPNFPRPEPDSYYNAALQRMRDLQFWLVVGQSPYVPDHAWEPI